MSARKASMVNPIPIEFSHFNFSAFLSDKITNGMVAVATDKTYLW